MFDKGDAIVHPARGVGIVTSVEERKIRGTAQQYYTIDLLDGLDTRVMVPVAAEDTLGLRPAIPASQLQRVWRVLSAEPQVLPADHKERNRLVDERLAGGDTLEVAAVVRDLADRERQQGELTIVTKRHLRRGLTMLAGEIAAVQGLDLDDAEVEIRSRLRCEPTAATPE
jgi:CarD family transcriptional regulator